MEENFNKRRNEKIIKASRAREEKYNTEKEEKIGKTSNYLVKKIDEKIGLSNLAKSLVLKLDKEIEKGNAHGAMLLGLLLAISKDYLDFCHNIVHLALWLTGFGIIASIIIEIPFYLIRFFFKVFILYYLISNGFTIIHKSLVRLIIWLIFGTIPVTSFFPLTTIYVVLANRKVKKRAKKAKKKKEEIKKMSKREMERLNEDISRIDYE